MMLDGTVTRCTECGTTVPTLTLKFTLLTRLTLPPRSTVSRIFVRCSVDRLADAAPPWPPWVVPVWVCPVWPWPVRPCPVWLWPVWPWPLGLWVVERCCVWPDWPRSPAPWPDWLRSPAPWPDWLRSPVPWPDWPRSPVPWPDWPRSLAPGWLWLEPRSWPVVERSWLFWPVLERSWLLLLPEGPPRSIFSAGADFSAGAADGAPLDPPCMPCAETAIVPAVRA